MDPQPTDPVQASGLPGDADRDARIEQLLLAGLDHYFAGQYERAIGVWTRVVFLERRHDRARAYIERARSALAEQQRQSDELLGSGVAAYNAGDMGTARDLLTRAADQGSDTAHVFLDRLNRLGTGSAGVALGPARPESPRQKSIPRRSPARRRVGWVTAAALMAVVAAGMLVGGLPIGNWISGLRPEPRAVAQALPADPLPLLRGSEIALLQARALHEEGRLRDALQALDRVGLSDPLRGEADRLRGQLQQELLAAAGLTGESAVLPQRLDGAAPETGGRQ